jgi:hypothetical protein
VKQREQTGALPEAEQPVMSQVDEAMRMFDLYHSMEGLKEQQPRSELLTPPGWKPAPDTLLPRPAGGHDTMRLLGQGGALSETDMDMMRHFLGGK